RSSEKDQENTARYHQPILRSIIVVIIILATLFDQKGDRPAIMPSHEEGCVARERVGICVLGLLFYRVYHDSRLIK
ncbi:unnamed protein product, partial [Musa acuminata subsp. malaccensis]